MYQSAGTVGVVEDGVDADAVDVLDVSAATDPVFDMAVIAWVGAEAASVVFADAHPAGSDEPVEPDVDGADAEPEVDDVALLIVSRDK
ncbi:MAG: hypothetical protein RIS41_210 [Actinomycetota bacterium]